MGSLFRTAAGAGIERIVLSPFCPTPERKEVIKTALGGEKVVPWEVADIPAFIRKKKTEGYTIAALEQAEGSVDIFETAINGPIVLIVGHEREGVSAETLELCDIHLELPMRGAGVHSLNVSNAASIALYVLANRT